MISDSIRAVIARGAGARRIELVVLHTEGDGVNSDTSAAAIRAYHKLPVAKGGKGWRDIGYNLWVRMNGLVEMGRPFELVPSHCTGLNPISIGLGFAGDGDIADLTLAQYDSLFEVGWLFMKAPYNRRPEHFIGHREAARYGAPDPRKTCPGRKVDLDKIRALLAEPR